MPYNVTHNTLKLKYKKKILEINGNNIVNYYIKLDAIINLIKSINGVAVIISP